MFTMRVSMLLSVVGLMLFVTPARAEETGKVIYGPDTDGAKYGNAGCGLGSMLFRPSNSFEQVFAATTNGSSGAQTFGISSGTSNCDGAGYRPGSTTAYVQTNRAALAKDIARGQGATLTGLSEIAGCADPRAVGRRLQANFTTIFPGPEVDDKAVSENVVNTLRADPALRCKNLVTSTVAVAAAPAPATPQTTPQK